MRRATTSTTETGRPKTYSGDIPPASPAALAELEVSITLLNQMAAGVSAEQPWTAAQATSYDIQTIEAWNNGQNHTDEARALIDLAIRGVYGEDAGQISLLDLLAQITGVGGDINTLIGSAQSIRFDGGPQQLSERLAKKLPGLVMTGSAVVGIERGAISTVPHRRARQLPRAPGDPDPAQSGDCADHLHARVATRLLPAAATPADGSDHKGAGGLRHALLARGRPQRRRRIHRRTGGDRL